MKRSEMIALLDRELRGTIVADNFAEQIVDTVIKAGMLPPTTKNPLIPKDMNPYQHSTEKALDRLHSRRNPLPDDYYVNIWDEEDDDYCGAI